MFIVLFVIIEVIENSIKFELKIKWLNDIYIGKWKICGVLMEM